MINRDMTFENKADWKWEDDLQIHVPCCRICGNGPLVSEGELKLGFCLNDAEHSRRHNRALVALRKLEELLDQT